MGKQDIVVDGPSRNESALECGI